MKLLSKAARKSGRHIASALSALMLACTSLGQVPLIYQGVLHQSGFVANGRFDFQLGLYSRPDSAAPLGQVVEHRRIVVENGAFTLPVVFGEGTFDGTPRWLSVSVRAEGEPLYTELQPRSLVANVPQALHATIAERLPDGSITEAWLAPGSVTRQALANGSVTLEKLNGSGGLPGNAPVFDGNQVHWKPVVCQVESILELPRLDPTTAQATLVLGYYKRGDGGGGLFLWDPGSTQPDDRGKIIAPTPATSTGRWRRSDDGPVSIKWFGAVPNDPSMASANVAAIQRAIQSIGQVRSGFNGGRIVFPPGKWHVNAPIEMATIDSIILQSSGAAGYYDEFGHESTALVWSGPSGGGPMLRMESCSRSGVRGLAFDGRGLVQDGIQFDATAGAGSNPAKQGLFEDFQILGVRGVALRVGNPANPDIVNNTFRNFLIDGCGIGILQEGGQCVQNVYERGTVINYSEYGCRFNAGDVTLGSIVFSSLPTLSKADVFVAGLAGFARFANNYHETFHGSSYLFEPYVAGVTRNRPRFTQFEGVRVQFSSKEAPTGEPLGTPARIIDFRQTGYVTLTSCEFDGFDGNPCEVYWRGAEGANPANIHETGCVYINGARANYVSTIGGFARHQGYGGLDPAVPPLNYSADFRSPNSLSALVNTRLNLHNSVLTLEDTYPSSTNLLGWNIRSETGTLSMDSLKRMTNGSLVTIANRGEIRFQLSAQGGPGFFGVPPADKQPRVTGSIGGNAALKSLVEALSKLGLIEDATTP